MATMETTLNAPLTHREDGSIRVTGSRVPIDTVIYHFKLGATAEEIGYKFASLRLADVYGVIYYYLAHTEQVEAYLREQEGEGDGIQLRMESDPEYREWKAEMRERLLKRRAERNTLINSPAAD